MSRCKSFATTDVFVPFFVAAGIALGATGIATQSEAAEIVTRANAVVVLKGEIVPGDAERLENALRSVPKGDYDKWGRVLLTLNSPGGNLNEGVKLGIVLDRFIERKLRVDSFVPWDAICASSCVSLFAFGHSRQVGLAGTTTSGETIGNGKVFVHSAANYDGTEDDGTMAITLKWARVLTATGAPASVIGKLVATKPEDATALSGTDLTAWKVQFIPASQTN